jgi:hypothetical protein
MCEHRTALKKNSILLTKTTALGAARFCSRIYVISEMAEFQYKCTGYYNPVDEYPLLWNDETLNVDWPLVVASNRWCLRRMPRDVSGRTHLNIYQSEKIKECQ